MQPEFARMADEVLAADGFCTRNLEAARQSPSGREADGRVGHVRLHGRI